MIAPLSLFALPTSQLVLMIASFVAMFGFAGVAAWLWLRQRQAPPALAARIDPPRPKPAPIQREPERGLGEATEFVALPGQREDDSPRQVGADPVAEVGDRTEFVAPPSELTAHVQVSRDVDDEPVERTEFIPSFAAPTPALEERTSFVAPPEPQVEERTSFVAAPPSFAAPSFAAPQLAEIARPPILELPDEPSPLIDQATTSATTTDNSTPELREHFELAAAALAKLDLREDADEATRLHGHLEVLASAPIDPLLGLLRPVLAEAPGVRVDAAWLALLHSKAWPAKRALPELLAELDDRGRTEALRALASWDDPRAPSLASAGLEHSLGVAEREAEWLELFASRGWDPGDAAIDRSLSSKDPRLLIAGLRLAGARAPEQVRAKVSAQLFASDPAVRIEAIETALVFREQSAWLVCRQLARNPAFPRAAELVGLLGSETEVAQLCQAASIAGSGPLLWGLGLSGRAIALAGCVAALDDGELRADARVALALALGRELDSPEAARELSSKQTAARLIGGAPRTLTKLAQTLAETDSLALRHALARELRVRARGRVLVTPELRPRAWRRQLDALPQSDIDLTRDFPW